MTVVDDIPVAVVRVWVGRGTDAIRAVRKRVAYLFVHAKDVTLKYEVYLGSFHRALMEVAVHVRFGPPIMLPTRTPVDVVVMDDPRGANIRYV